MKTISSRFSGEGPLPADPPQILFISLNPRDAGGGLSGLMAASSTGTFMVPPMAQRFRSAVISESSAIQSPSRAAPKRCSISRCWLRGSGAVSAKSQVRGRPARHCLAFILRFGIQQPGACNDHSKIRGIRQPRLHHGTTAERRGNQRHTSHMNLRAQSGGNGRLRGSHTARC